LTRSKPLVFLGGTSGQNTWRKGLLERLASRGVDTTIFFDPVVDDWNEEARQREEEAKANADIQVFHLGNPKQPGNPIGAFSLVEATLAVCDQPEKALLIFDLESVEGHARRILEETEGLLRARDSGAVLCRSLAEAEDWLAERFA
jgi:hypothetical protein